MVRILLSEELSRHCSEFNVSIIYYVEFIINSPGARINPPFTVVTTQTFIFPLCCDKYYYLLSLNWVPRCTDLPSLDMLKCEPSRKLGERCVGRTEAERPEEVKLTEPRGDINKISSCQKYSTNKWYIMLGNASIDRGKLKNKYINFFSIIKSFKVNNYN